MRSENNYENCDAERSVGGMGPEEGRKLRIEEKNEIKILI